jgi:uncharacterized membrane protein
VTLELKNEGKVEHNFSIASQHIDKDIEAGESDTVKVKMPSSGTGPSFAEVIPGTPISRGGQG